MAAPFAQKIAVFKCEGSSLLLRHIANTAQADDTRIAVERTVDEAVMRAEYEEALAKAQLRQVHAQEEKQAAERHLAERRKLANGIGETEWSAASMAQLAVDVSTRAADMSRQLGLNVHSVAQATDGFPKRPSGSECPLLGLCDWRPG